LCESYKYRDGVCGRIAEVLNVKIVAYDLH